MKITTGEAPTEKPRWQLTLHLDYPGGSNVVTDVVDADAARDLLQKAMDSYYQSWSRKSTWICVHGTPFICFPIERLAMFSIKEKCAD